MRERKRYLIAIDADGVHVREVLCVTHHGETGEVTYQARPAKRIPRWMAHEVELLRYRVNDKRMPRTP